MAKLFVLLLCVCLQVHAQDTSYVRQTTAATLDATVDDQLLKASTDSDAQLLLPHKMMFTQRVFWGPNGLLRVFQVAPLTQEGRKKELKVRAIMLLSHKVTGYATLAGFVAQGILGLKMNNATGSEYDQLLNAQQTTRTITNIAYGTTALLSLTAPPKLLADQKARSGVRLHKYLSIIHLAGFIATNVLAGKANQHTELRPYQQVATFTTAAALAPALIALKF
ncbi:hypothetical protein [Spirosoma endbachense]|uniref:Uncharacterized protein n=1 Tax=Spirosoma endbachense TaxID=2666025 RepID=A0A6P1VZU3_9BACT|nr:hypothetical protein [Spirosoma endbachense]QHV96926.1 hypothetical protein GJR95_18775 [Spirosoma endbachense]